MTNAPESAGPLLILADTYAQALDFAYERGLGPENLGQWVFIRGPRQARGRRDGRYVELLLAGHWRSVQAITERLEVLEILRCQGFARLDPSAVNGAIGESKNGTGGRETGQGPAHRFDHNRWSDPAPGVQALAPGVAMLACACGTVLDADDMVRAPSFVPRAELASGSPIPRIVCMECAAALVREDAS